MHWRHLFQEHILLRGFDYADSGYVKNLKTAPERISATVEGTSHYHIEIQLKNGEIQFMGCTCPYAEKGYNCKHMAAVLCLADNALHESEEKATLPPLLNQPETDLKSLLSQAQNADLISFLLELSEEDPLIESRLKTRFAKDLTIANLLELKAGVNGIFRYYAGRNDFVDYYHASDFVHEISGFIQENIDPLIENGLYSEAFEISLYIFIKLGNQDMDDSDGGTTFIAELCYDRWKKIISNCSPEQYSDIKDWFLNNFDAGIVIDYMEEVLQEFLERELATPEEQKAELEYLDKLIEDNKDSTSCPQSYSMIHGYEPVIFRRIELMRILGADEDSVEEYMRSHIHFRVIRDKYIGEARKNNQADTEISLLEEGCRLEEKPHAIYHYKKRLAELYRESGNTEKEKQIVYDLYMNYSSSGLKEFLEYKQLCSRDEWISAREKMIAAKQDISLRCILFEAEDLIEELFQTVMKSDNINLINKYCFLFADEHSEDMLSFYTTHVTELAESARNNARYEELSDFLTRMLRFDGGTEKVRELANTWSRNYATRRKMVEMLRTFLP